MYLLISVVVIAVGAMICDADGLVAISRLGRTKRGWFARFLDLSSRTASHDRLNAIFAARKPVEFEKCLLSWIKALHEITGGQAVAIDGQTLGRSFDTRGGKAAIHIGLGQVVVDQKSNAMTAIPKWLEVIDDVQRNTSPLRQTTGSRLCAYTRATPRDGGVRAWQGSAS